MKRLVILQLLIFFTAALFAQEKSKGGQFWASAGAETALYGLEDNLTFSLGLQAGYSFRGGALSAKAAWFGGADGEGLIETTLMARFWLGSDSLSGGFFQFQAGAIFFAPKTLDLFGAGGEISASVSFAAFGYRFPLGDRYFIEPVLRFGYPYLAGASLSAGMHF